MKMRNGIPVLALVLALSTATCAQQTVNHDNSDLSDILVRMKSADLHTQKIAFDQLMVHVNSEAPISSRPRPKMPGRAEVLSDFFKKHPGEAGEVKLALIQMLETENNYFIKTKSPPPDANEEDDIGEHYAELIDTVGCIHDERAIPALVGAMTTGGMAQRALMAYGDKALEPVLIELKNPDALVRATALGVGIALLQKRNDTTSQTRIRNLIRSSLTDPRPVVRSQAIKEIACLSDRQDFVSTLQQIASSDSWKLRGKADDGADRGEFYPVRFDARQVLRDIQSKKTCNP
jgi:hypothetical protein